MGFIVPQTVKVRTNSKTYKYYKEKGYTFKNAERIRKSCYFIALTNGLEIDV